jgi:hypothetical protein
VNKQTAVSEQLLGKHARNNRITVTSMWFLQSGYKEENWGN